MGTKTHVSSWHVRQSVGAVARQTATPIPAPTAAPINVARSVCDSRGLAPYCASAPMASRALSAATDFAIGPGSCAESGTGDASRPETNVMINRHFMTASHSECEIGRLIGSFVDVAFPADIQSVR